MPMVATTAVLVPTLTPTLGPALATLEGLAGPLAMCRLLNLLRQMRGLASATGQMHLQPQGGEADQECHTSRWPQTCAAMGVQF